jgi:predicted RNase H-like HicB family nuclease
MSTRRYLIVIEGTGQANYSAYGPDIPGVAATGATQAECERQMREAITFHVEGLAQDGEPAPEPHSTVSYAVVDLA